MSSKVNPGFYLSRTSDPTCRSSDTGCSNPTGEHHVKHRECCGTSTTDADEGNATHGLLVLEQVCVHSTTEVPCICLEAVSIPFERETLQFSCEKGDGCC